MPHIRSAQVCLTVLPGVPLGVPVMDGQGWGAYLVPLMEGAPGSTHSGLGHGAEQRAAVVT